MNFVQSTQIKKYIKKYGMQYFIILGMRSNGKSTAVKKHCLEQAFNNNELFFYVRRYSNDLKTWQIESYFESVEGFNISEITKNEYDKIVMKKGKLYLSKTEIKDNKKIDNIGQCIGYVGSLSDSEHLKSLNFPNCKNMIFEEFVTDKIYLNNEVKLLFNLVSTVFRNDKGIVFLVGNTISEINPYFREFELTKINSQKVDTIDIYKNDETIIAVWLTGNNDISNFGSRLMSFGERSRMIKNGDWDRDKKRKLEFSYKEYNILYTMVFKFHDKKFLMEFLEKDDFHVWFVSPKTTEIQKDTRIISDTEIENDYVTIGFIPISKNEQRAFNYIKQGKIAYSDNLTGTEFLQCYKQLEKGL